LSDREVSNIIRDASETMWPHLFRKTVTSDIVKQDNTIIAAFKVQKRLDLEDMRTAFHTASQAVVCSIVLQCNLRNLT
jgi:hypothetical protein